MKFTHADKICDKTALLILVNYLAMLSQGFPTN